MRQAEAESYILQRLSAGDGRTLEHLRAEVQRVLSTLSPGGPRRTEPRYSQPEGEGGASVAEGSRPGSHLQ
jgi:hypothetical protein